ncbi:hypothetical protein K490DRAFT_36815 [Saccharata proteae CBS 121410]|uniref:DUF8004 domain-containing protein n=1 Tax=Saccharata proteae CBS 121410 TaxID=1314787 RepID=A0A6A5YEN9_9PEZI|nr:hypothetical protein K490DRAFT_36815 [Saccharata proteae CBS 121410]
MEKRRSHGAFSSSKGARPQRWDGLRKDHCDWDGLRKDSELWFPDGDCFVHLYEKGHSRRGPSFCISLEALQHANCGPLFSMCFAQKTSQSELPETQLSLLRDPPESMYELYIPAPEDSMREDMFRWHMTTRNFFAFIFKKPLVGTHLGGALVQLQERLHLFRSSDNSNYEDFMAYAEQMGYSDMANAPDHALAMLYYAEHYTLQGLWTEAYAHCVGMNDVVYKSSEYEYIPRVTIALITRAYLEMDLHLLRVSRTLSNFLEDDFSPANLGLPQGARSHLERFRSFLNQFYMDKYGYWPPPKKSNFPRALYRSMYYDFNGLYDFLVDSDSSNFIQFQKPASGGVCVLQNVQAFDQKHRFTPLDHPMPLLPASPAVVSHRGLVNLKLGKGQSKSDRHLSTSASLSTATNRRNSAITNAPLVKAYKQFEEEWSIHPKDKVSLSDARKVRWILIYGILQTLISVTRAPQPVRDTETPEYPLCCLTAGTPPWKELARPSSYYPTRQLEVNPEVVDTEALELATDKPLPETPSFEIKPDCEAGDYLTHTSTDHRTEMTSPDVEIPAPLRINTNVCMTPSKKGSLSRNTSYKSIIGRGLSPFSRRNSIQVKPHIPPFCEIQVPGYGNGLNETILEDTPESSCSSPVASPHIPPPGLTPSPPPPPNARTLPSTSIYLSQPAPPWNPDAPPPSNRANSTPQPSIPPPPPPSPATTAIAPPRPAAAPSPPSPGAGSHPPAAMSAVHPALTAKTAPTAPDPRTRPLRPVFLRHSPRSRSATLR